jgi:hypothetical protein
MTDSRVRRRRWLGVPERTLVAIGVVVVLLAAACSNDEPADPTTTTTTTSPPPATTAPDPDQATGGPEQPPAPEWIVQIGGAQDDSLLGVSARGDELVATGYTEGDLAGSAAGGRDVLVATVGTDSEIKALTQFGNGADDTAFGVGSAEGNTVTCGYTESELGGPNSGSADAWCAPIDAEGSAGTVYQQGGSEDDRLHGTALTPDGDIGYAGGYTQGLFPGASDSSAGSLGEGDALIWQINPDGTPRWIRQFGTAATDWGQGVASTADGDGLIVGYTQGDLDGPSNGGTDGFLARFDRDGLPRFVRQFGTTGADWPKGVAAGGEAARGTETFVTVGSTDGALAPALGGERTDPSDLPRADGGEPAPSNAGETDVMVMAMDPGGETRWASQLGSDAADDAIGVGIDGSTVLVAGTTSGALDTTGNPNAGGRDGFLAAVDLDTGELRWVTQFGSEGDEDVHALTITEDGLVVVSGQTTGALGEQPNAGGSDGFLIAFPLPRSGGSAASAL